MSFHQLVTQHDAMCFEVHSLQYWCDFISFTFTFMYINSYLRPRVCIKTRDLILQIRGVCLRLNKSTVQK